MCPVYADPPLLEAFCDFQFEAGSTWDSTIPGLLYARVRDKFPEKEEQQTFRLNLMPGQLPPAPNIGVSTVRFLRKDRTALIQVGPNSFGFNHLRPYPTWERFRDLIFQYFTLYVETAQPKHVARVNLRYINKVEIPMAGVNASVNVNDYFLALPGVPQELMQQPIIRFIQRVEIPVPDAHAVLVLQSGILPPEREDHLALLLDLDVVRADEKPLAFEDVQDWMDGAHKEVGRAFEACITDKTRELFGGKR